MLAKCGVEVVMSDLFGMEGAALLDTLDLPAPFAARVASLRWLIEALEFEINLFAEMIRGRPARDPGRRGAHDPAADSLAARTSRRTGTRSA